MPSPTPDDPQDNAAARLHAREQERRRDAALALADRHRKAAKEAAAAAADAESLFIAYSRFLAGTGAYPAEQLALDLPEDG